MKKILVFIVFLSLVFVVRYEWAYIADFCSEPIIDLRVYERRTMCGTPNTQIVGPNGIFGAYKDANLKSYK